MRERERKIDREREKFEAKKQEVCDRFKYRERANDMRLIGMISTLIGHSTY